MWPYWFLFGLTSWLAISQKKTNIKSNSTNHWPDLWRIIFLILVLMIGLRHEVGGDWFNYLPMIEDASYQTISEAAARTDPAYGLLNFFAANTPFGVYLVNIVCSAIFSWGLVVFCRAQPRPWLALVVAVPYLITVVAMGYTRQGVAIGLVMLGLASLGEKRVFQFVFWTIFAALFHKSALILLPLASLAGTKRRLFNLLMIAAVGLVLYFLLLQESVEGLRAGYVEAELESAGATIRIAMNAMPSILFLLLRHRFQLKPAEQSFWTWMAIAGLCFVPLLILSPSSTAVDRVALYWIPLQLFVLSRLPDAIAKVPAGRAMWVRLVVIYSGSVLFVWLIFGAHSSAWLPYQFYPWEWLWKI